MAWDNYYWQKKPKKPAQKPLGLTVKKTYGSTWWGARFLDALTQIDEASRLPRGKTYANRGAAHSIQIEENTVFALVEGSEPKPYRVRVAFEKFKLDDQKTILQIVSDNPFFLSKLLNRELPTELEDACWDQKIELFPAEWSDLDGSCSCPDYAVPCKHMAAVLFLVAAEIDQNPFLLFELRGFDLLGALENGGFSEKKDGSSDSDFLEIDALRAENALDGRPVFAFDEAVFEALDFSKMPDLRADLLRLLTEKPVFFPEGDFKKELSKAYENAAVEAQKPPAALSKSEEKDIARLAARAEGAIVLLDDAGRIDLAELIDADGERLHSFENAGDFVAFLAALAPAVLAQAAPEIRGLALAFLLAENLARRSAFVPQLVRSSEGFSVRFVPAVLNAEVRAVFEAAKPLLPVETLFFSAEDVLLQPVESDAENALLAAFLAFFVQKTPFSAISLSPQLAALRFARLVRSQHKNAPLPPDHSFEKWFFDGTFRQFDGFGEREKPLAVQLWLSRFFMSEKPFVPVFQVFEDDETGGFELAVAISERADSLAAPVALSDFLTKKKYENARSGVLRDLAAVAEFFAPLERLIASRGAEKLRFDGAAFAPIFFEALPVIRLFGIQILLPKGLQKLLRPTASGKLSQTGKAAGAGLLSFAAMVDFDWQIALGDRQMTPAEFLKTVKGLRGIVRLADGWAFVDEAEVQLLIEKMKKSPRAGGARLLQIALAGEWQGTPVRLDDALRKTIAELLQPGAVGLPEGLRAELRPYQKRGFEWLWKNARLGFGSLIGDDMGLGKTVQVIALLLKMRDEGLFSAKKGAKKAIVVVPTTLLTNWQKELSRFAPSLRAHIFHGPTRSLAPLEKAEILLTTYGAVRSDLELLSEKTWAVAVIDEAQNIKNLDTAQTRAVKNLPAPLRIAMTGTPVENRLSEYFSILDFANPGLFGSLGEFMNEFSKPIEVERDHAALERFRKSTEPFLLRRLKTDKKIISDLPDKVETDQFFALAPKQAALYQTVVEESLKAISAEKEGEKGIKRDGLVLKMLTALKQVCNHPAHFLKTKGPLDPALSGKTERLLELVEALLENGEKALIFTQYEEMGSLLAPLLEEKFGFEAPFLHGGVSRKKRDAMVEHFQNDRSARLFLLSLKAGGTGLNLTAASTVIHYDLWWNPAVETQATDRAFRIGQTKNVQVHRLIAQGTFEEKIDAMLRSKRDLANLTVAAGEKWVGDLSNAELRDLVRLG